jgi:methionyl-tRNA formyltransferase
MGTAELSCTSLEALTRDEKFRVIAVVTQPDKPKGRDLKLTPSPVKILAEKMKLPVLQPLKARDEKFIGELRKLKPDLIIVVAYGQILPQTILDLPQFGCLNVHTSLLPKYRGAAPIQWAIADGETETGVTIMKMDASLDTGPILSIRRTPVLPTDDSQILHDRLAQFGAELLVEAIPNYIARKISPQPQPTEGSSYAAKIKKEDGRIDWNMSAEKIWNRLRAFTPWPGAFTFLKTEPKPQMLKILKAEVVERSGNAGEILSADKTGIVVGCGQKALRILELQREGGRRMNVQEFLTGYRLETSKRLEFFYKNQNLPPMKCFNHNQVDAIASCVFCGIALCPSCITKSSTGRVVCSTTCTAGASSIETSLAILGQKTVIGYKLVGFFTLATGLVFAVLAVYDIIHAFSTGRWNLAFLTSASTIVFIIFGVAVLRLSRKKLN